ncbi:lysophospholipase L1-like esterase [Lewinella marina]|uniref:G-D-S-L family lipolytic protein n=1 Tax=Neolewinella marina TaxID=438751 RepID=A0A2G0CBN8_9BACT|nr:GDSL-type esterase/lipase family protein [Neolewinella marina]NJB87068.1 lysophospholipase L1-like esterase [Neolewinella marina]PHK97398.1 G-D-S-L family lipolytic protein [Neolewinella marina]
MRLTVLLLLITTALYAQSAPDPTRFAAEIEAFATADAVQPVAPGVILFVGSSSVRMWHSLQEDLEGHRVLNRGFGGSQFTDLIHYADRLIYPYKPRAVFVYEGDNDIAAGDSARDVLRSAKKLRKMIAKNLSKDTPVVFISPKPSVARWELHREYEKANDLLEAYAAKQKHTYFVDVWTPALLPDGTVRKDIFLADNLHMTPAGYDIWEAAIEPVVELLDR